MPVHRPNDLAMPPSDLTGRSPDPQVAGVFASATRGAPPAVLPSGAVRLDDWGVIRASGADAATFLHGQLTQDIEHLAPGSACLAGYCSVKGRMLASFVVWRPAPDEVALACSADLLPAVLKRLSMFVMRARCKLTDASAELPLWGLAGAAAEGAPQAVWDRATDASGDTVRLPSAVVGGVTVPRALRIGGVQAPAADSGAVVPGAAPALDLPAWRWLEVYSGVARVVAATSDQFVPQTVNLELVGGVHFQKGCYPGQEVVARSQYRGSVKRRAAVVSGPDAFQPGQEIVHSGDPDQPAGVVVLAGAWCGRHAALVQLKLAALDGGTLHAGSLVGAPLTVEALPYPLPADAAD